MTTPLMYRLINFEGEPLGDWTPDRAHLDAYLAEREPDLGKQRVQSNWAVVTNANGKPMLVPPEEAWQHNGHDDLGLIAFGCPSCHGIDITNKHAKRWEYRCLSCGFTFETCGYDDDFLDKLEADDMGTATLEDIEGME